MRNEEIHAALRILRREVRQWQEPVVGVIAKESRDPFRVLISCVLSLRTKDRTTAEASRRLFALATNPNALVKLSLSKIQTAIYPVGFYRTKSRQIQAMSRRILEAYGGRVPDSIDELLTLPGVGRKTANLVVTALNNPPATATPGSFVTVADTVQNQSRIPAGSSRTQYYLSVGTVKGAGDKLLGGRAVPALAANATSSITSLQLMVPTSTVLGTYYLLACADDTQLVAETDEAGNCRASTSTVEVGRPDLTISAVINPSTAVPGAAFQVSDTVQNLTTFSAGISRTQYYL